MLAQKAALVSDTGMAALESPASTSFGFDQQTVQYRKFTSQDELGHFLLKQYKIRPPNDLASCEVCHR
jgi:hypothetical protein